MQAQFSEATSSVFFIAVRALLSVLLGNHLSDLIRFLPNLGSIPNWMSRERPSRFVVASQVAGQGGASLRRCRELRRYGCRIVRNQTSCRVRMKCAGTP